MRMRECGNCIGDSAIFPKRSTDFRIGPLAMSKNRDTFSPPASPPSRPPSPGHAPGNAVRHAKASPAFWMMVRRVTVLAATVDLAFLIFFLAVRSPILAWINLVSIAMYAAAWLLLTRRCNVAAVVLIWVEVVAHAAIGTMLVGWDSGFHYYLLMFIPAIVISGSGRTVAMPLMLLFVVYLGLQAAAHFVGALTPLGSGPLLLLNVFNVSIFFGMASYTARFYYGQVRKSERKLRELATLDTLTGLANRRHLLDVAQQEIARAIRTEQPLSLVLADIDDFKLLNDAHGHDAGDQVLIHASQLFRGICRAHDLVARWGGEEFLFLLPATDQDAAQEFAERLRLRTHTAQVSYADKPLLFSLSMGVATMAEGESLQSAIGRADSALYRSKNNGRDRVTVAIHPQFDDAPAAAPM